ncbi:MAG: hypothetical protein BTN85_2035 [Candidatus Methanohalarchaeum thermophilum]|uniref:Uncharacterized protein n=1 Tax=Methanohalarchaeum thermophilum TaxID=1903181 RepID=A0A1Q6DSN8_METT1|nr:MAG: hypothetical protein BTN85_2035 [Candidatus Methanohalarchaeum thermophilum]
MFLFQIGEKQIFDNKYHQYVGVFKLRDKEPRNALEMQVSRMSLRLVETMYL